MADVYGDVEKPGEKISSPREKVVDNDDEIKGTEPKEETNETQAVCKKEPKTPRKDKSPEKEVNLKNDLFYLDVVDDKKDDEEKAEDDSPKPPPTPRRVNKMRDHTSNIFPAGCMGCREDPPSDHVVSPRRFLDNLKAKDYVGNIDNAPRKRPSSAKPNTSFRNPLTGVGLNDEEVRKNHGRRRDGNPLLGEGYETKQVTPSATRIPPGGYSQGLW